MGHGFVQRSLALEEDERAVVRRSLEAIRQKTGKAPRGWLGPGLGETFETPDLLAEEGIEYVCDWVNDDLPYKMKVRKGDLYSVPYTLELNDIPMYIVQHHRSPEIFERTRDQFDALSKEATSAPRIMAIAVHPYISGVPHRIGYLEKAIEYLKGQAKARFMTGSEILDWYRASTLA
jgi:peptidoglycan/xylan/chitin deacetylase (PgdA/CDA1 family)